MNSRRSLQTILFTDIVGSTERAADLGDGGWRQVLEEHHARVRREIRRFGGREVKTMGDGFLAAFPRPAQAIRCAWSIREMAGQLGLEVRCGIHTGEVERRGKDLEGIAVHIGSRIADAAGPGETLVSNAVREMETGTGFRFKDRGRHDLKGVPGEWRLYALEGLPAGPTFRTGRWVPEITTRHAKIAGMVVVVLVAVVGIIMVLRTIQPGGKPPLATAEGAAPAIAVLPFDVSGPETDEWHEGMVTLLSTGLDGVGDLRAIDSRTVLAQWDQQVPGGLRADRDMALQVARATGARYALLGSAVSVGSQLRLVGEIYSVEDGSRLGTAQVEGAPDGVLSLVDDLARETLAVILEKGEGEIPPVDLAALTTSSLPAIKAFLKGEALYRRGAIEQSIDAYERAVETDSTFALASMRLASAYGWMSAPSGRVGEYSELAVRHADRLPERTRLLVEAQHFLHSGRVEGLELVREATHKYPDDAYAWYLLGEFQLHHRQALASLDDAEAAYLKAVELDPSFAPYRFHPTELAFSNPPDSALAADRVNALIALDSLGLYARASQLGLSLAFGDPARRSAVLDSIRFFDAELIDLIPVFLQHPRFWEVEEKVTIIAAEKGIARPLVLFFGSVLKRGQVTKAMQYIDMPGGRPGFPACALWEVHVVGIQIPKEVLEAHLALRAADSTDSPLTACKGFYALDQGRRDDYARSVTIYRRTATRALAQGDSATARKGYCDRSGLRRLCPMEGGGSGQGPTLAERGHAEPDSLFLEVLDRPNLPRARPTGRCCALFSRSSPLAHGARPLGRLLRWCGLRAGGRVRKGA